MIRLDREWLRLEPVAAWLETRLSSDKFLVQIDVDVTGEASGKRARYRSSGFALSKTAKSIAKNFFPMPKAKVKIES
jgi:hypothetical protein